MRLIAFSTWALLIFLPAAAVAQTCTLDFTIELTQGAGTLRPGSQMNGDAHFTPLGRSIPGEGGTTSHLASGEMRLGDRISGNIWAVVITSDGAAADLVGVYARDVEGLNVAGIAFDGPMALTLFGPSGTRPDGTPPTAQEDWDRMDLRRAFSLQAPRGRDMLAGDVTSLRVSCF